MPTLLKVMDSGILGVSTLNQRSNCACNLDILHGLIIERNGIKTEWLFVAALI